jgi:hypothetical protein
VRQWRNRIADGVCLKRIVGSGEFVGGDIHSHVGQEFAHGDDVANHGDIVERKAVGGEQGSGHGGQRGVFCPADRHGAVERSAAGDEEFVHEIVVRLNVRILSDR